MQDERGGGDTERILLEIVEFVEEQLRRQDRRSWHGGSVRGSLEGPSRSRLEIAPRGLVQNRVDGVMRNQIEDVVVAVLKRLRVEGVFQESVFVSDKSTSPSAGHGQDDRQPLTVPQPGNYALEGYHDGKGTEPAASGSSLGLQSSSHTVVNHSDRYSPLESNGFVSRPQRSPAPRHGPDRKHNSRQSHPPQSRAPNNDNRVHTSAPSLDNNEEQFSRNAGDDGYRFTANAQRDGSWSRPNSAQFDERRGQAVAAPSMRHGKTRGRPETEAKRRRRWDATLHIANDRGSLSSDESEDIDLFPTRSRTYPSVAPRRSQLNRRVLDEALPPVAPDPPFAESNPKGLPSEPLGHR